MSIEKAIEALKALYKITAFEDSGILVIPCSSPEEIYDLATKVRSIFKEIGYSKSWRIDPYYYSKRNTLNDIMYNQKGDNYELNKE